VSLRGCRPWQSLLKGDIFREPSIIIKLLETQLKTVKKQKLPQEIKNFSKARNFTNFGLFLAIIFLLQNAFSGIVIKTHLKYCKTVI